MTKAPTYRTAIILSSLGLTAGLLGGLLGIGGGSFVVPGLVFFLGFSQHKAHGTSLVVVLFLSVASVLTYSRHGYVDWQLAAEMAAGGVAGACLGSRLTAVIHGTLLRRIFCVFLIVVGVRMIVSGCFGGGASVQAHHSLYTDSVLSSVLIALGVGVVTGILSGLLGIGGGMVMVPAMVLLLCVDQHTAQGVSLAAMMPTSTAGMLVHRRMGNVDFRVARWVGPGAAIGAICGAGLAGSLDASTLRIAFGVFLAVMAVLMALKK